MPYTTRRTSKGVTVTSKDTGKTYHVKNMKAAEQLKRSHEIATRRGK